MPSAMNYIPPNDKERASYIEGMSGEANEYVRRDALAKRSAKYYIGNMKRHLDVKDGEPDDNVVINNYRRAVDRTLAILFPTFPRLEYAPIEEGKTKSETWIEDAWSENDGLAFLIEVAMNGCYTGQCYVKVQPPAKEGSFPRLVNIAPSNVVTYWRAEDPKTVFWHSVKWGDDRTKRLQDFIYDPGTETWRIKEYEKSGASPWTQTGEDIEWDYKYGPIISWSHLPFPNSYYGLPEVLNYHLIDSVNLVMSENMRINRYHASPKTVAIGIDPDEIQATSIDGLWTIAENDAQIMNLEMSAAAPQFSMGLADRLEKSFMSEQRVVILEGGVKDFQRVTNPGIRTVFMEMIAKNSILRWNYGQAIIHISAAMSYAAGNKYGAPDIIWPDPLPRDDKELAEIAKMELVDMKIASHATVGAKRGYNVKVEKAIEEQIGAVEGVDNSQNSGIINNMVTKQNQGA